MRENAINENRHLAREPRTSARGWEAFERDLAAALAALDDECMVVSAKEGNRFVQFGAQPSHGLRAEVVSNAYLDADEQLGDGQLAELVALGWSPPTGTPGEATPEKQPQGSPNFFRDFPKPIPCGEVARMAVHTLAGVLRIADPSHLQYRAFDAAGHTVYLPELHLADAPPPPCKKPALASPGFEGLRIRVRDALRNLTRNNSLDFDSDGDIPVQLENTIAFVRVIDEPLAVRVYSVLAPNVDESESLLRRLHQINIKLTFGRLVLLNGCVFGSVDILASPFVPKHLIPACAVLDGMAARLALVLRIEFARPLVRDELRSESLKN